MGSVVVMMYCSVIWFCLVACLMVFSMLVISVCRYERECLEMYGCLSGCCEGLMIVFALLCMMFILCWSFVTDLVI